MLTEIFWTFLCTSIIGCFLACIRMAYKSKCSYVKCCGLTIRRDIDAEENLDGQLQRTQSLVI